MHVHVLVISWAMGETEHAHCLVLCSAYRTYAQRNARLVELMEQNSKFRKRLEAIQKDVGLDLASVLIKPIQR